MVLTSLYQLWFDNKKIWFSKNNDILLSKFFLLDIHYSLNTKEDYIGYILMLDQISRHYFRNTESNHILTYYSYLATKYSNKLLLKYKNFTEEELLFIYLPYRHIFDFKMINKIICIYIQKYKNNNYIFFKNIIYSTITKSIYIKNRFIINNFIQTHNSYEISKFPYFQNILEFNPLFKLKLNGHTFNIQKQYNKTLIVSLSGGVDSNVLLYICSKLSNNVIAIHINYNNRKECDSEENFLKFYCKILKITLYIRKIDEIQRDMCKDNGLRDIYEEITKKIRFDMYKQLQEKYITSNGKKTYIVLGHNLDDTFENIITNISKKQKYENLEGMSEFSDIDNIHFWRPFLHINKETIIKYAYDIGIPFLKDSTPNWSQRGKIRDIIKPCLFQLNEFNFIKSLFDLSNQTESLINIINELCIPLLLNNLNNILPLNEYIWKQIFDKKEIKISNKCLKNFIEFIKKNNLNSEKFKTQKFILNKKYKFEIKMI
jgi:tRNA(Ile)-lysidine synthetase-like protein